MAKQFPRATVGMATDLLRRFAFEQTDADRKVEHASELSRELDALIDAAVSARALVDGDTEKGRDRLRKRIRKALGYTYP